MSTAHQTPLDQFTLRSLITLGAATANDRSAIAEELKLNSAFLHSRSPDLAFEVIHKLSWDEAFKMIQGLTLAEMLGVSNYRGSVSLVKYVFRVAESRDPTAAMELAAWIVDHSDNPYIPFEMRKIRFAFERIKQEAASWEQCREQLSEWKQKEWKRQNRLAKDAEERRSFAQKEKPAILEAVRNRCNAEKRRVQIAKSSARKQLLDELASLPPRSGSNTLLGTFNILSTTSLLTLPRSQLRRLSNSRYQPESNWDSNQSDDEEALGASCMPNFKKWAEQHELQAQTMFSEAMGAAPDPSTTDRVL